MGGRIFKEFSWLIWEKFLKVLLKGLGYEIGGFDYSSLEQCTYINRMKREKIRKPENNSLRTSSRTLRFTA